MTILFIDRGALGRLLVAEALTRCKGQKRVASLGLDLTNRGTDRRYRRCRSTHNSRKTPDRNGSERRLD